MPRDGCRADQTEGKATEFRDEILSTARDKGAMRTIYPVLGRRGSWIRVDLDLTNVERGGLT